MNESTIYDFSRVCKTYYDNCSKCPLAHQNNEISVRCDDILRINPDKANEIILNWCKEHPVETRQDRLLKMFPTAKMDNYGVVRCCPVLFCGDFKCDNGNVTCPECRKNYWLAEVEENE